MARPGARRPRCGGHRRPAAARLDELRLLVRERHLDAELRCGRHADVIAELEALVAEHPLREGPGRC